MIVLSFMDVHSLMSIPLFFFQSDDLAEQLWWASRCGSDSKVLKLLQKGAPPDGEYYHRTFEGRSPLWISCYYNHPLSAKQLLKWGASVTTTNELGCTPLHVSYDSMDCARLLLEHHSPKGEPLRIGLFVYSSEIALKVGEY